jgi:hypothetical protein
MTNKENTNTESTTGIFHEAMVVHSFPEAWVEKINTGKSTLDIQLQLCTRKCCYTNPVHPPDENS